MKQGEARPLIIAHRGASAHAPENTLAAIKMAIDVGADGVEFDVRLAADGVPVVIHDPTLKRVAARRDRVADLTSAELGRIDVGSWFNARYHTRARAEFVHETVPTLANVLDVLASNDGLIYVELKCTKTSYKQLAAAVCQALAASPLLARVIIKSFYHGALGEIHRLMPELATAVLFKPSLRSVLSFRHIVREATVLGAPQISIHQRLFSTKLAQLAARQAMPITVWTVDDPGWLQKARHQGVAALITNDPAAMIEALGRS
jgi:glycerophosphoryl diester phosphodiesterase